MTIIAVVAPAAMLLNGGLPLLFAYRRGGHARVSQVVLGMVRGLMGVALGISMLIFATRRWSFKVYPDRVRSLSKRRTVDIPFDRIKNVRTIAYQHTHMFGPVTMWKKISLNCDPRYSGYGMGQSGILHGVRHVLRIESPHGWRLGYILNMENPAAFVATLNRALER